MKTWFHLIFIAISFYMSSFAGNELKAQKLEDSFEKIGFVAVNRLNHDIMIDLMYAGTDNFTGIKLYDGISDAFLHPDAAEALNRAQTFLQNYFPGCHLIVKDAARPMSVQRKMFSSVQGTPMAHYVANPAKGGGLHNYGLAVDITIIDSAGKELPMGTPVDHLGVEANIDKEELLVDKGIISETERQNRLLLRRVMTEAGFLPLRTEWWHFNLVSLAEARLHYRRLDF